MVGGRSGVEWEGHHELIAPAFVPTEYLFSDRISSLCMPIRQGLQSADVVAVAWVPSLMQGTFLSNSKAPAAFTVAEYIYR